jgi:hypothetical protein
MFHGESDRGDQAARFSSFWEGVGSKGFIRGRVLLFGTLLATFFRRKDR